jgi:hypothetical protein
MKQNALTMLRTQDTKIQNTNLDLMKRNQAFVRDRSAAQLLHRAQAAAALRMLARGH